MHSRGFLCWSANNFHFAPIWTLTWDKNLPAEPAASPTARPPCPVRSVGVGGGALENSLPCCTQEFLHGEWRETLHIHNSGRVLFSDAPESRAYLGPAFQTTLPRNKKKNPAQKLLGLYLTSCDNRVLSKLLPAAAVVIQSWGFLGLLAPTPLKDSGEVKIPI